MLTVLEAIKLATEYFEKKEIESARRNAELLLAHLLNCKRLDLYLMFERPLNEDEIDSYRELIARRGKYEPVQYIIGYEEFFGLKFLVDKSVLIPRPETEILVETIINSYNGISNLKVLDIGTGSGNIAVSLKKYLNIESLDAIDISDEAINIARKNAELNLVSGINFSRQNVLNGFVSNARYDLIVSNPPYISEADYESLQKEILLFEPKGALSDNSDGLEFYRRIIKFSCNNLNTNGKLFFELGNDQSNQVEKLLTESNFKNIAVIKDYQQIDRVISGEKS
ncbi:MAG: peptide chain release factor N(5)-glutamine methyltransferase [Bacteroidota bacterium]